MSTVIQEVLPHETLIGVILSEGGLITGEHLPLGTRNGQAAGAAATTFPASPEQPPARLHDVQPALIAKALADANGNRSHTARLLGLSRGELYAILRRYSM